MKTLSKPYRYAQRRRGSTHISRFKSRETLCKQSCPLTSGTSHGVTATKKRPICKKCEAIAERDKLFDKDLKVEPCPKCGNDGIVLFNCGYSAFNPGGGECTDCGYKVSHYVDWDATVGDLVKLWNRDVRQFNKRPEKTLEAKLKKEQAKTRKLRKQLRDHGFDPIC
jgi:hypothetical protein